METCQNNFSVCTWYWSNFKIFNLHEPTVYAQCYLNKDTWSKIKMNQLDTSIETVSNMDGSIMMHRL